MANHYLSFSEVLSALSVEETAWLRTQLESVEEPAPDEAGDTPDPGGPRFLRDYQGDPDELEEDGFQYRFLSDKSQGTKQQLWVFGEESGDLGKLAHLVQKFIGQFRPEESWSLTYATTCSKPRVGQFGGGALFVTANSIDFHDVWDWLDDRRASPASPVPRNTETA